MKLPISWKKVRICVEELSYCGYKLTPQGIRQDDFRVKALARMRPPLCFPELDIFMGMANYHREFIKDYASVMKPLLDLQNTDRWRTNFKRSFSSIHLNTFRRFMELIQQDTLLSRPGEGEYHVFTDMSEKNMTLSAQLIRVHKGKRYLISYASKRLSHTESSYSTPKLEMMAIWFGLMKFKPIICGRIVKVFTDHRSLTSLHLKDPRKRWATWLTDIIEINPEVIHVAGKDNPVADAITRLSEWANTMVIERDDVRKKIVAEYHHHFSDRKTVMNIRQKYDWDGIHGDVSKYRESCEYCQKNRGEGESRVMMKPIIASQPNQIIGIDIKGPINLKNQEKKQYGIAVDYFTKYTYIFPLSGYTAAEFWSKFEKSVLDNISTPKLIIGDSAKQFLCEEAKKYKDKYLFNFQASTAYRHQANGEVENKIKFVDKLMHSFLARGVCWRESIRQVKNIVNNQVVNDSTKFTPYELSHGHKHISPFDAMIEKYLDNTLMIQKEAKANIEKSKLTQQYYYNKGKSTRKFNQDDWVLIYDNHRKGYQSDMRRGPYKIEKVLPDDNYLVHDHNLGKWNKMNVEKLKLFIPVLDSDVPPLEQDFLERGPIVQQVPLMPKPPEQQQQQQEQHQQQQQQPILFQQQPEQQQQQQQQQSQILTNDSAPPDQSRYSIRSRGILPGKSYDYQYRKNTYS
jgi:hypothetical protein